MRSTTLGMLLVAALTMLVGCAPKSTTVVPAPTGNWVSLFNGKNLDGWVAKIAGQELGDNFRDTYRVEDGLLKVSYDHYDRFEDRFGSLFYNKKFSHYWVRAEYRFVGSRAPGAPSWAYKNSGLQLHCQAPETMDKDQHFPVSVEFDMVGGFFFNRPTGNVCQNGTSVIINGKPLEGQCSSVGDLTVRDDSWTTALAEVDGSRRVRQIVNGTLVVEYTDLKLNEANADARRLISLGAGKALASGYLSIQSNGHPIEFRRIEVLPIDEPAAGGTS